MDDVGIDHNGRLFVRGLFAATARFIMEINARHRVMNVGKGNHSKFLDMHFSSAKVCSCTCMALKL